MGLIYSLKAMLTRNPFALSKSSSVAFNKKPKEEEEEGGCRYLPGHTTIPLMTNQSYDKSFLKRISVQTATKMSLKFNFELNVPISLKKLCYYFATARLLI